MIVRWDPYDFWRLFIVDAQIHWRRVGILGDESKGQRLRMKSFWVLKAIAHVYMAL